ncbi:MAG: hypothetical protein JWP44_4572, partial [Mucilaginibacter sp.]|nr:hypothetical protein [Mucilaginibacter sp.]
VGLEMACAEVEAALIAGRATAAARTTFAAVDVVRSIIVLISFFVAGRGEMGSN